MVQKINSATDIRHLNRRKIYQFILKHNRILSKQDISYELRISQPTVTQNLNELAELGLIKEAGELESTGGRKAKAISPLPSARVALGLDITKNHISIVAVNLIGELLKHTRIACPFSYTQEYFSMLTGYLNQFTLENGIAPKAVLGAGVSVPGIISDDRRRIAHSHVLGMTSPTGELFEDSIPYPFFLCNDANAAGLAEVWGNDEFQNVVYLSLSNSVGGSIFSNHSLYTGEHQRGGEFGHMTLYPGGKRCYCGKQGCLDAYCSAALLTDCCNGSLEEFFAGIRHYEDYRRLWEEYQTNLAFAVNNLRMSFDCNIILGGYVGSFMEPYLAEFQQRLAALNTFEEDGSYVSICRYRLEASAIGAALQHIDRFINSI